jgi:hypothetical protein
MLSGLYHLEAPLILDGHLRLAPKYFGVMKLWLSFRKTSRASPASEIKKESAGIWSQFRSTAMKQFV